MDIHKKYRDLLLHSEEGLSKINLLNEYAWEISRIDTAKAFEIANQCLVDAQMNKHKKGIADAHRTIAQCYWLLGDFSAALKNLEEALPMYKSLKTNEGEAQVINLYGGIYSNMNDFEKAIEYYDAALKIREKIGNKVGIVMSMNSIGDSLIKLKRYDEALSLLQKALNIEHDNEMFKGIVLYNVSEVYYHLADYEKVEKYLSQCAKIGDQLDFTLMSVYCSSLLGKIELKKKNYVKAIDYLESALKMARSIKAEERIYHILEDLSLAYELTKKHDIALKHYKEHHLIKEKVISNESKQQLKTIEQRLVTDRLKKEAEKEKLKNAELQKAYEIIEENRNRIAVQNQEITDSIRYAKRIQEAILPSEKMIKELLPESFVFYRPKDLLSGDFYWVSDAVTNKQENFVLAAVADCTGHGVPGALMSIIGNNYLRICEREPSVNSPAQALDFTNAGISKTLRQEISESKIKDGMDISFIAIDYDQMKLHFAGAKNSMILVREDELIKYKGDSHPVGAFLEETLRPFTNNSVDILKGDTIYLFSDGYADQFGGSLGKKFMYKRFRDLLLSIRTLSMPEQKQQLEKAFDDWRMSTDSNGAPYEHEQVDDVCVMGIRI